MQDDKNNGSSPGEAAGHINGPKRGNFFIKTI
jgi:hypothetical protein